MVHQNSVQIVLSRHLLTLIGYYKEISDVDHSLRRYNNLCGISGIAKHSPLVANGICGVFHIRYGIFVWTKCNSLRYEPKYGDERLCDKSVEIA